MWISATLLAALFQAWRTAVQQRVRAELSVNGAGLVRYLYGLPVACLILCGYWLWRPGSMSAESGMIGYAAMGGLAQVLATNLLIMAFGYRNFVTGTAYAKTEAVQTAVLATALLNEHLSAVTWSGIAVGVVGVLLLSTRGARRAA
jgi:drug/metabolite transporter (DMT)-like permease